MKKLLFALFCSVFFPITCCYADNDISAAAANIIDITGSMSHVMGAAAVCIGLAFFTSALLKLKYHRDNPTQVSLATAVLLFFFSLLLFGLAFLSYYMNAKIFGG